MKKLLSIVLAMAMVLALGVTAFAAETTTTWGNDGNYTNGDRTDVTAKYSEAGEATVIDTYAVTIQWSVNSTLKYSEGTKTYTWIVEDDTSTTDVDEALTWKEGESGKGWTGTASITVTITNRSSQAVKASVADTPTVAGASVSWTDYTSGTEKTIDSAAKDIENYSGSGEAQVLTLVGSIDANSISGTISSDGATVATITITLTK